jgi:predicted CopG family antitoxin
MCTKSVRLSEQVYQRIEAHQRAEETFSEAINRLIDDWSLLELAETSTEAQAERHRELLEAADELSKEDYRERLERMDAGAE